MYSDLTSTFLVSELLLISKLISSINSSSVYCGISGSFLSGLSDNSGGNDLSYLGGNCGGELVTKHSESSMSTLVFLAFELSDLFGW